LPNERFIKRCLGGLALVVASCAPDLDAPDTDGEVVAEAPQPLSVTFIARELVGRPTATSVTIKAIAASSVEFYVEYDRSAGSYGSRTSPQIYADGLIEQEISGLEPNRVYYYRIRHRVAGSGDTFASGSQRRFVTQRARGSDFTFDVQSDSHQGFAAFHSDALYGVTMQNILADQPDFLFDLGDTFSTDDAVETVASVRKKYRDQREVFDVVGHSSPVFLVLGNHENEEGWNLDDQGADVAASLPILGANARKRIFLNPVPNEFYSGNTDPHPAIDGDHLRGDYYAFEWGDALFVAIDPFWYTMRKPFAGTLGGEKDDEVVGDRWDWTLGKQQYDWLAQTLAESTARFKFVFAHHEAGGSSDYARAGAAGAKYGEWGGYDADGVTWSFAERRPGWPLPIHQLFVRHGVSIFFHGHDHVFAKEVLDGVVYQECPHAANDNYGPGFATNAEDYADGDRVNNSGHVRVTVGPTQVGVSYVRSFLPQHGGNRRVDYSYTLSCGSDCGAAGEGGSGSLADGGEPSAGGSRSTGGAQSNAGGAAPGVGGSAVSVGGTRSSAGETAASAGTPIALGSAGETTSASEGGSAGAPSSVEQAGAGVSEQAADAPTDSSGCGCALVSVASERAGTAVALALLGIGFRRRRNRPMRERVR
jgi:hypothetical protein